VVGACCVRGARLRTKGPFTASRLPPPASRVPPLPRLVVDLAATSVNWKLPPEGAERIRRAAPAGWDVAIVQAPTVSDGDGNPEPSEEARQAVADADAYFGFGLARPLMRAARRLRWVHSAAAGVRGLLYPEMVASDIVLTNSAGIHAVPISEHVLGGVIHLLRGFDKAMERQRAHVWDKRPWTGAGADVRELGELRALVVGVGGIGATIGARLAWFGARVTGIRRNPDRGASDDFFRVRSPAALDEELMEADLLVLAAPFTPETDRLIDARRLALLPRGAIVANVARGALLDTDAMVAALQGNRLRGAVLDVFDEEPLPPESPLWGLPQVLLTPHISAVSPRRFWDRQLSLFEENWRRWAAGEPLRNVVDKRAGY
jgi:phosphoglycerate dehydrogenase-like enzyme